MSRFIMHAYPLPSPLARAAMRAMPAATLQRTIDALLRRMRLRHPRLFQNLGRLKPATLFVEPADLPHRFVLTFGHKETTLRLAEGEDAGCDARIKGSLDALLNLLEGRIDGDTMFFTRDIEISGDTGVVVALRNTLDREEIDLLDDATSAFGPFARPARRLIALADSLARRAKDRLADIVEERTHASAGIAAQKEACDALKAEVADLKKRLATFEARGARKEAAAS